MSTKKEKPAILKRHTLTLACKLTEKEKLDRGRELAATLAAIRNEESRAEAVKKQLKSDVAAIEAKRDALATQVERGEQQREVECEDRAFFEDGKMRRFRLDTEEMILERALTPEEQQQPLPI